MGTLIRRGQPRPQASAMQYLLTEEQKARHENFKRFVTEEVEPFAEKWDREQKLPESVIGMLAK